MKVATWRGSTRFTIDEAPDPVPRPGYAVVAVHTAGICGTDVHATQGLFPWTPRREPGSGCPCRAWWGCSSATSACSAPLC